MRLEVAGDGPERAALEALAHDVAPGRVRFLGRLDRTELHRRMAGAAAVVVPSVWYENQPMVVLEAFALGRPVIGTDLGGTPELVDPGRTGWLVPPGDAAALSAAVTAAVDDGDEADRRGAAARAVAGRDHALDRHLAELDGAYRLAAERTASRGAPVRIRSAATGAGTTTSSSTTVGGASGGTARSAGGTGPRPSTAR